MSETRQLVSLSIHWNLKHYNMLDDKDKKLPDATENQSADKKKSVKKIIKKENLKDLETTSLAIEKSKEKILNEELVNENEKKNDEQVIENKKNEIIEPDTKTVVSDNQEIVEEEKEGEAIAEKTVEIDKELALSDDKKEIEEEKDKKTAVEDTKDKEETAEVSKKEEATKVKDVKDEVVESLEKQEKKSQDAVDEVEKHVAKQSENLHEVPEIPMEDYKALSLEGVVAIVSELIEKHPIQAIKKQIDVLKKVFNKQFGHLLKEAKTKFLEEGGNTIDFRYDNPIQEQYNQSLFEYKKRLKKYYKEIEKQYEENLLKKNNVIEELKDLIDNGEANSMYKHFKQVQDKWREIGPVSREHYSNLWRTYHFHVERFYDLLHLRNDLRDLDFKHNLDEKLKLIIKAEALAESDNIKQAFDELQVIHRLWKEEIGPVSRENREAVWEQFSAATKKIHDKRHEYFDGLKEKFNENLLKKQAVIDEIFKYDTSENKTHRDWQKSIKEIGVFREQFFAIGRVARSKNNTIWNKFKEATKDFNKKKNAYYKEIKNVQHDNLSRKMALVEKAESLRDSEDWNTVTEVMKKIQAEWKTIGHVPRKQADKIWNRFKEACNHYFDKLHVAQDAVNEEKFEVYSQKKEYLENLKIEAQKEDFKPDLEKLKGYIKEWREIGVVPMKQNYINGKFNKFLDSYFEKLSLNKKESTMLRYRNLIDSYIEQKEYRKLDNEIQFVRKKSDEITKEKQQLENNMLFFSNADESNPMIKNILNTIEKHKNDLEIWEAKLRFLRTIDV